MFKTIVTAAALSLAAFSANATPVALLSPASLTAQPFAITAPVVEDAPAIEEVAYFCEWVTVYDYYGNWVTLWQCY